jgi:hypothetical protein
VVVAALTVFTPVGGSGGRLVLGWKWRWFCGRRRVGAAAGGQICRRCWREKADRPASVGDAVADGKDQLVCGCCFSVAVGSRPREKKALLTWPFAVEKTEEEDAAEERGLRC